MPDWSYHLLFKPVLTRLPTYYSREFIHRGMNSIASLPGGKYVINFLGREESSSHLNKVIDNISFSNSIGLSGKVDPLLSGTKAFSNLGFGFLEMGPVTMYENTEPIFPKVSCEDKRIYFSENIESIGIEKTIKKLKEIERTQPIVIRVSGNKEELLLMIKELEFYADAFIIDHNYVKEILSKSLITTITTKPIYVAMNRDTIKTMSSEIDTFTGVVLDEKDDLDDKEYLQAHSNSIRHLRKNGYTKTIISVGGIIEPDDALQLFNEGADLVLLSGGYVFSGPGLTKRIKELQLSPITNRMPTNRDFGINDGWKWYFLFGLAMFVGGIIALIISISTIILPYDEHFLEMSREMIAAFNERILYFMAHDRMTLAGTIISGGIIYMSLARHGVRYGLVWAKQAMDIGGFLGFLGIFLFIGYGYFDWLHLTFWLVLLPFFIMGFLKTRGLKGTPSSTNRFNDRIWKQSLIGQLAFVILGFSFLLGGLIISYIGISKVFIQTDIAYICMPQEIIDNFNERLIPVIAHDRAGFGSALVSVGLLVLMLTLWGFQQGNRWVWWTFLIGGLPAFSAGLLIHFAIGYTTVIHLLPAYFALALFLVGLVFSYRFFHKQK